MNNYDYPFNSSDLTNHLGSNRVVATHTGQVEQRNMFYPYGASRADCWSDSAMVQRWKYSGKELDSFQGLHCYDYGFRWYDPIICRWTTPDPMREKYYDISAYTFCCNNPISNKEQEGLFPKSLIIKHDGVLLLSDYYTLTKPASHLLSLISGVSEDYITNLQILQRGFGHYYPLYNPNKGGGAITIGANPYHATITITENFFSDNKKTYNGNGYGQDIRKWLGILSHEVKHIDHIKDYGGKVSYLLHFLFQYMKNGHDSVKEEIEADRGMIVFGKFVDFTDKKYGENSLEDLFNSKYSDSIKIKEIDEWWRMYNESK